MNKKKEVKKLIQVGKDIAIVMVTELSSVGELIL